MNGLVVKGVWSEFFITKIGIKILKLNDQCLVYITELTAIREVQIRSQRR